MPDSSLFEIHNRSIGRNQPTYFVAEMSANHRQELSRAKELIHAMKESGADAVKLQTYTPDTITLDSDAECFRIAGDSIWGGRRLHDLYGEAFTPWQWHGELFELARSLDLVCFSSPFDKSSVDFLEQFDPPAYKIASFELVDLPLIEYVAQQGRPIVMSTGMGSKREIGEAIDVIRKNAAPVMLLKCTSAYPSPPGAMNLRTIGDMAQRFSVPVGLSDHTLGNEVAVTAVALGACLIEKHFILSRGDGGPDSSFSMEPDEFKSMVNAVRIGEQALGRVNYKLTEKEQQSVQFRRSLFAVDDVQPGERLTEANVRSIRPSAGLSPKFLPQVIGRVAKHKIPRGSPLTWEDID